MGLFSQFNPRPVCGLLSSSGELQPLCAVDVSCKIRQDFCCEVVLTQEFQVQKSLENADSVEVKYHFPMDGNAAVFAFQATLEDGNVIRAKVQGKEEAKQTYDQAKSEGKKAFLLERVQSDIFQIAVGNVKPTEKVKIEISYVAELTMDGGKIRLRIPNHIAPKCGGRIATKVDYPINFAFDIKLSTAIGAIQGLGGVDVRWTSIDGDPKHCRGTASKEGFMNEDLILLIPQENPYGVYATVERSLEHNSECVRVTFNNDAKDEEVDLESSREIIFLVDRSGSMQGDRMETTKKALDLFLRSLPLNCRFNIVTFNSGHESLSESSLVYDDDSIEKAQRFVDEIQANGGTNILSPFESVTQQEENPDFPRSVIILTDGEVGDPRNCIDAARRASCRVCTIGVGSSFSQELVEGMATAANGLWQAVRDVNDLGAKVTRALSSILAPTISNLRFECDAFGNDVSIFPKQLPSIVNGVRTTVYFHRPLIPGRDFPEEFTVTFFGKCGSADFQKQVQIHSIEKSESSTIHRIGAMQQIRFFERLRENESSKSRIREIGLKYNLASSQTSFVAVQETPEGKSNTMTVESTISTLPPSTLASTVPFSHTFSSQPSNNSGGLFGTGGSNSNRSGGLFGSSNQRGGLFGTGGSNSNRSGGLFGSNTNNTSSGLFGSSNKGGGLFGTGRSNNNRTGGLFGNNTSNNTSSGLFGRSNQSGGLFGSGNNSNRSGRLFGSNNNSGGLFGNNNASGSLFGSKSSVPRGGSLFGANMKQKAKKRKRMNSRSRSRSPKKKAKKDSTEAAESSTGLFEWIVRNQSVTGKFLFDLSDVRIQPWQTHVKKLIDSSIFPSSPPSTDLVATLIALYILTTEFADRKAEYALMHKKATRWVKLQLEKSSTSKSLDEILKVMDA